MQTHIALMVMVMVVATQLSRVTPLFLSRFHLSDKFKLWLSYIPVSVLTALIVPEFFEKTQDFAVHLDYLFLISGSLALIFGIFTRNLLGTTLVGVLGVALLRLKGF